MTLIILAAFAILSGLLALSPTRPIDQRADRFHRQGGWAWIPAAIAGATSIWDSISGKRDERRNRRQAQAAADRDFWGGFAGAHPTQSTPWGTSTWDWDIDPATGAPTNIRQDVRLSPDEQTKLDQLNQLQIGAQQQAMPLLGDVGGVSFGDDLARALQYDPSGIPQASAVNQRAEDLAYGQFERRLNPMWGQARDDLEANLAQRGLTAADAGWGEMFDQFGRARNDAYLGAAAQAAETGRAHAGQLYNQSLTSYLQNQAARERPLQQRLSYLSSLLSGTAPPRPQFGAPPPVESNYGQLQQNLANYGLGIRDQRNRSWGNFADQLGTWLGGRSNA